ncbi:L-rhamnonate dehydratase [Microbacterium sp. Mu-80]|uniref:L-rhamnonate dehydratase n=1 Tax=Microbacterium bandirmense TaxID=3122050 RepID=A0ABU8L9P4_9MICO
MSNSDLIVSVRAYVVPSVGGINSAPDPQATEEVFNWQRQKVANPMTKYPEFRDNRSAATGRDSGATVLVEVESASGVIGIATTNGGVVAASIIELHLADMVEGESPFAHERVWDRMFRSTMAYGRKGVVMHAISAVDLAVWDLHGKLTGMPVWALLGGKVLDAIEVYGTGPTASSIEKLGFWGAKLPLTWGPSEGAEGFRRNIERARIARETVGDDFPLFYDCWMALDVDYAARLAAELEPLGFLWIEEPLLPDDYAGHAELRRRMPSTMMLNTGEHEYTAYGHKLLCEAGVDVLQPDPNWCGGITELRRIAAVANAHGKRIIPHVGGQYTYHFLTSYAQTFVAEFPVMQGNGDEIKPFHAPLLLGEALPVDGKIVLDDSPGFGLTRNEDVRIVRPMSREALAGLA